MIEDLRAAAEFGTMKMTSVVMGTRGARIALVRARHSGREERREPVQVDLLYVVEINEDDQVSGLISLDPEDFDSALAELDARYLAGEAAPYARTWSAIARAYASISGGELAATTPDWINIDHRRTTAFAAGEAIEYIRAAWDLTPKLNIYVEAVHRLNDLGAVVAHAAQGSSRDGFDAEWRATNLFTVDGDKISRTELFDQADIDVVIAQFEELSRKRPSLENAVSRAYGRLWTYVAAGDWAALTDLFAEDLSFDDRRRTVNAGVRHGRAAELANLRAIAGLGILKVTPTVIATRGERLAFNRVHMSDRGDPEAFYNEVLSVVEMNADERLCSVVLFDLEDFDAAVANSTPVTSRAKQPHTRTLGRSSHRRMQRSLERISCPRRRRTGSTSTTDSGWVSQRAT
jgi:SnoaL-like domain